MNTWLLDRLPSHIPVMNAASGIRAVNEKVWVSQFTSLVPRTLISRDRSEMMRFIAREKNVIAKPTDAFGGQMVFLVKKGDSNINVILEALTQRGTKEIILQQYIPAAAKGDKRILLLNGEPLGAVLRVHAAGEHRNNFFAGGKPVAAKITARDKEIIAALKPHLIRMGLYFVGIDVIGDYLIEVNVTSPTCLQEINRLYKKRLEDKVIDFVEGLIEKRKSDIKII
jgi:glutathione synthase